jgi:hypothetical protein
MIPQQSTMDDLQQLHLACVRTVALIDTLTFAQVASDREWTLRRLPSTLRFLSRTVAHALASLETEGIR